MKKITIIFGSSTGNTEKVALMIKDHLIGFDTEVINVVNSNASMIKTADLVLLGSSTWGYGEIQDDFLDFYDSMNTDLLGGKNVGVFGCGDSQSFSDVFCKAVDLIIEKASDCGASVLGDELRVDGEVEDNLSAIEAFAKQFV